MPVMLTRTLISKPRPEPRTRHSRPGLKVQGQGPDSQGQDQGLDHKQRPFIKQQVQ